MWFRAHYCHVHWASPTFNMDRFLFPVVFLGIKAHALGFVCSLQLSVTPSLANFEQPNCRPFGSYHILWGCSVECIVVAVSVLLFYVVGEGIYFEVSVFVWRRHLVYVTNCNAACRIFVFLLSQPPPLLTPRLTRSLSSPAAPSPCSQFVATVVPLKS